MASASTLAVPLELQVIYPQHTEHKEKLKEYLVPPEEFPEGGLAAWATAFGAFLIQFCTLGYSTSFGVYQDFYAQSYLTNETSSAISWIGSLNAFLISAVGLLSGSLYDRGYFYHLMVVGSILQGFSLFMLSLAKPNQYYQIFLAQGLASGIASGLLFVPCMAVISHHFRRKRTVALTFAASGSSLGAVIHPIMLNNLLNGPVGFANGVRASAGLISGLLLIATLCMRTRLAPPTIPVNYIVAFRKSIHDLPFVVMVIAGFLFLTGFYYPIFYLQVDSMQHGINTTFSFYSLVILNAANFVGRLSSAYIAVYTGVAYLSIASTIMCGGIILGMIGLSSLASVAVIAVLYGYVAGLYSAMAAPLLSALTPDMSELGARMGICFCVTGVGLLIGTPISGALLTSNYIWWAPAVFAGVMSIAGGLTFALMQFMLIRRQAMRDM